MDAECGEDDHVSNPVVDLDEQMLGCRCRHVDWSPELLGEIRECLVGVGRRVDEGGQCRRGQAGPRADQEGGPRATGRDDPAGQNAADGRGPQVDEHPQRHDPAPKGTRAVQLEGRRAQGDEAEGRRTHEEQRDAGHGHIGSRRGGGRGDAEAQGGEEQVRALRMMDQADRQVSPRPPRR